MAQRVLRFGIGDGAGHRAATWKLWTETSGKKSEVYLACRSLGVLKASLHESGAWHIAYSRDAYERDVEGTGPAKDRFIEKWPRPSNIAPGVTLAFRIVTPWSAVTTPIEDSSSREIAWLPNASEAKATEIDILIVAPSTSVAGWPGKQSMGTSLIGSVLLENGESVWAVYSTVNMPDLAKATQGEWHFYKGRTEKDLDSKGLRMLIFGAESDGSRVLLDCAVKDARIVETTA